VHRSWRIYSVEQDDSNVENSLSKFGSHMVESVSLLFSRRLRVLLLLSLALALASFLLLNLPIDLSFLYPLTLPSPAPPSPRHSLFEWLRRLDSARKANLTNMSNAEYAKIMLAPYYDPHATPFQQAKSVFREIQKVCCRLNVQVCCCWFLSCYVSLMLYSWVSFLFYLNLSCILEKNHIFMATNTWLQFRTIEDMFAMEIMRYVCV
jgi:hypothetical protein